MSQNIQNKCVMKEWLLEIYANYPTTQRICSNPEQLETNHKELFLSTIKYLKPHASLLSIIISIIYSHNYNNLHILYPNHSLGNNKYQEHLQNKIKDPYGSKERQDLINFLPLTFLHSSLIFLPFFHLLSLCW